MIKSFIKYNQNTFLLAFVFLMKSFILLWLPKYVINTYDENTYSTYVIFNNYFSIICILSLVTSNRLLLKSKSYDEFLKEYRYFLFLNYILYFFITLILYHKVDYLFFIFLALNSIILFFTFIFISLIYKKNIFKIFLNQLIYLLTLFFTLYIIKKLNFENELSLIIAFTFTMSVIVIINFKDVMLLFDSINLTYFKNKVRGIFKKDVVYLDVLKKIYLPLLLYMIFNLYEEKNNFVDIVNYIGIATVILYYPGNLISRSLGLIQIGVPSIKREFMYSCFISVSGIFFFILIYYYGFKHIADFYFQEKNNLFQFIFTIFLIYGVSHYLSEIYMPFAIKSNNVNIILYTFASAIFFLVIIFIFANIYNLEFKLFIILAVVSFSIAQFIAIFKINLIWYRLLY